MSYLQRILANTLTFIALSVFLPNDMFHVSGILVAILASFVLSILNMCVKPILQILSLPITLITFGIFSLVINGVMLKMTSFFMGANNFYFSSIWVAIFVSLVMSAVNAIVTDHRTQKYY